MLKLFIPIISSFIIIFVHCTPLPQSDDVEVGDGNNRINEAEFDYKFALEDGHERQQQRKEIDGATVVIGFYKYTDPDGKERTIYYKADKKGYQVSYDKPFEFPSELESERLSAQYLPPKENLIRDVLPPSNEYLPPSNSYLPPN